MKITEYYDIYMRFLAKIEDEYLASLNEEQLHTALYPILLSAINTFARLSEHDLRKRDERMHVFYETLTDDEIEVLAVCMKPVWLERYINSSRKIEQQYYDAGIKTYSPNENLRNLTVLYQQYLADMRKVLHEYTYNRNRDREEIADDQGRSHQHKHHACGAVSQNPVAVQSPESGH